MLLFFVTDLHGSDICFKKFINAVRIYKADVAVIGGDLTGKMLIPIIRASDNTYQTKYYGTEYIAKSERELEEIKTRIRNSGYYPYITTKEELENLKGNKKKLNELFIKLATDALEEWLNIAKERLKDAKVPIYVTGGNDDEPVVLEVLKESDVLKECDEKVIGIEFKNEEYDMLSLGYSNPTPWNCPRDICEEELAKKIEKLAREVGEMQKCIFNIHVPPFGTILDLAPKFDENFNVKMAGGQPVMVNVGSKAVREMIEKYQPLLGLHGHIHESKGITRLKRTLCVNPGSEYGEGILRGILIKIIDGKVQHYLFTYG
jgi:Icc-related predicted phosphoesterase